MFAHELVLKAQKFVAPVCTNYNAGGMWRHEKYVTPQKTQKELIRFNKLISISKDNWEPGIVFCSNF